LLPSALLLRGQQVGLGAALLILRSVGREVQEEQKIYEEMLEKRVALAGYF